MLGVELKKRALLNYSKLVCANTSLQELLLV